MFPEKLNLVFLNYFCVAFLFICISISESSEPYECAESSHFKCANGRCIVLSFKCDEENDCGDNSDESNCSTSESRTQQTTETVNVECSQGMFSCGNKCIPDQWVCDGAVDCPNGKDEGEVCLNMKCSEHQFRCKRGSCIDSKFICDGDNDCGDGSDEDNCTAKIDFSKCNSENGNFKCKDESHCIPDSQLCDGVKNCNDGSDEDGQCKNKASSSEECKALKCSHMCIMSPFGPICACPEGTRLSESNVCIDINECAEFGTCDQSCVNTYGSFICSCDAGYILDKNSHSCRAQEGEAILMYSNLKKIRALYLKSHVSETWATDVPHATGVGYDGEHVYWTTVLDGMESIMMIKEDGTKEHVIVDSGLGSPEDLAYDWVTGNIYFTDGEYQQIGICSYNQSLDVTKCAILHDKNLHKPRGIALSPVDALMYWSDWGMNPRIVRSGMDGSDYIDFVTKDLIWPNGLTIDQGNRRLYWVDAKQGTIETIKFDQSDRRQILSELSDHPFSIAIFEDKMYWSGWTNQEISVCNKFTGGNRSSVIKSKSDKIFGIHIYHPTLQNHSIPNPCSPKKCSDICVLAPPISSQGKGYSCMCPDDKILSPSGTWCDEQTRESIIISVGSSLFQLKVTLGKQVILQLPVNGITSISALAYNSYDGSLIIADPDEKKIFSYHLNTNVVEVLVSLKTGSISTLAYDYIGRNLYWCDKEAGTIDVLNFATRSQKTVLRDFDNEKPFAITLVPEDGIMFVAAKSDHDIHIDRVPMDGSQSNVQHISTLNLKGPDVTLHYDHETRRVYWADMEADIIENTDADGNDRHIFRQVSNPIALTVVEKDVYWTSRGSSNLFYSNKFEASTPNKKINMERFIGLKNENMFIVAVIPEKTNNNHPCSKNNGNCSHLCLLSLDKKVCSCPDGMKLSHDEQNCEEITPCSEHEYHCTTGECIPLSKKCDRNRDCPYGEDEIFCPAQCTDNQFACFDGQKCIDISNKCDFHFDCHDHSDEINCHNETCNLAYKFKCKSGECISRTKLCSGSWQCKDGSDEENCGHSSCLDSEFRCTSGTCIPKSWRCDRDADCDDESDEKDCSKEKNICTGFSCLDEMCIDQELVCNGKNDCADGSDETNCESATSKSAKSDDVFIENCNEEKEFMCEPGKCIDLKLKCNGKSECENGADEMHCIGCEEFSCNNKKCITYDLVCNGENDCGDFSDELPLNPCPENRESSVLPIVPVENCEGFICKNGECLHSLELVCDKVPQCKDGSDEGGRCGSGCVTANCSETCRETPFGGICSCAKGFKVANDNRTCVDIDECVETEPCSQICYNTYGSYECNCLSPYYFEKIDGSCKANGPPLQYILSTGNQIRQVSSFSTNVKVLYYAFDLEVTGFDINMRTEHIYWTSGRQGVVTKMSLTHKFEHKHLITKLETPSELVVDWITDNIYFVQKKNQITVCNFGVELCSFLLSAEEGYEITSLAVDPLVGYLFWSETSKMVWNMPKSILKRADMDGKNVEVIVSANASYITDIALDNIRHHVFWVDKALKVIEKIDYDGSRRLVVLKSKFNPKSVSFFDGTIFWSVESSGFPITKCPLLSSTVQSASCSPLPIRVIDPISHFGLMQSSLQRNKSNPCSEIQCDHMCLLSSNRPTCICQNGKVVLPKSPCNGTQFVPEAHFQEVAPAEENSSSYSWSSICAMTILIIFIGSTFYALFYYYYSKNNLRRLLPSMHFKNPAFDLKVQSNGFVQSNLNPSEHQFENPLQQSQDGQVRIICGNEINISRNESNWPSRISDDTSSVGTDYADLVVDTNPKLNLITS